MGWFSDILSVAGEFLGVGGAGEAVGGVVDAATEAAPAVAAAAPAATSGLGSIASWAVPAARIITPIAGGLIQAGANQSAANRYAAGQTAAAQALADSNRAAIARLDAVRAETAPARERMIATLGTDPNTLTPSQMLGREDVLRSTTNQLAASGLRGSGRAGVRVLSEADRSFKANAVDQNLRRGDQAASQLASIGAGANQLAAQTDSASGARLAAVDQAKANDAANFEAGQGRVAGSTLGAVTSAIANSLKDEGRQSRYPRASGIYQEQRT